MQERRDYGRKNYLTTKYTTDGRSTWFYRWRSRCLLPYALPKFGCNTNRESLASHCRLAWSQCDQYHHAFLVYLLFLDRLSCGLAYQGISQNSLLANQDAHSLICCHFIDSSSILDATFWSSLYCLWDRHDDADLYRYPDWKSPLCDFYDVRKLP